MRDKLPNRYLTYKISIMKRLLFTAAMIILAGGFWLLLQDTGSITYAAGNQVSVTVDYLEETATVKSDSGSSTKFYYSTDKKNWEYIDSNGVIDISALLQKKAVSVFFKGNKETEPFEVQLQAEDTTLKASYQVLSGGLGAVVLSNANYPVEYRKGSNGQWKTVSSPLYTAVFETKGTSLYFRTTAALARRAGAIVTVRIPKRPSAPSVKLDGSKLLITGLKSGETLYRIGDNSAWTPFAPAQSSVRTLDLAGLLLPIGTPANSPIPAGIIEFRTKETDKKVASSVKILEIPAQPIIPNNVQLNGTTLSIQDSDLKRTYEYTRVEKSGTLNIQTARWSTLTAAKPVIIPKASVDDKIYVRIKSVTDRTTKLIVPASTYVEKVVTSITIK